jgi:hypothetical protein
MRLSAEAGADVGSCHVTWNRSRATLTWPMHSKENEYSKMTGVPLMREDEKYEQLNYEIKEHCLERGRKDESPLICEKIFPMSATVKDDHGTF